MATRDTHDDREARYLSGQLEAQAEAAFEAELASAGGLGALVEACHEPASPPGVAPVAPSPSVRQQLLDLAHAPTLPVDLDSIPWEETVPGLRMHVVHEDPERGMRGCLVWAQPGFKNFNHRHLGDELILVLDGELRDDRGVYKTGEICHSRTGSIHYEHIPQDQDCLAYVVYYGELEPIE